MKKSFIIICLFVFVFLFQACQKTEVEENNTEKPKIEVEKVEEKPVDKMEEREEENSSVLPEVDEGDVEGEMDEDVEPPIVEEDPVSMEPQEGIFANHYPCGEDCLWQGYKGYIDVKGRAELQKRSMFDEEDDYVFFVIEEFEENKDFEAYLNGLRNNDFWTQFYPENSISLGCIVESGQIHGFYPYIYPKEIDSEDFVDESGKMVIGRDDVKKILYPSEGELVSLRLHAKYSIAPTEMGSCFTYFGGVEVL